MGQRGVQHVHQHRLVARRHQHHVRQAAQVGDVEDAVVGRPVVADQSRPVHREDHRELLQADVVYDLIVGPLQEGRVDGRHRPGAAECQPGCEQDRLLLGDADVEIALRHRGLEDVEARAGVHRGGDADHPCVAAALCQQRLAEDRGVLRRRRHVDGLSCSRRPRRWRSSAASRRASAPCPRARRSRPGRNPCP